MIDLGAELLAALRSPDGRAAVADAVRGVVAEEVRTGLERQQQDRMVDLHGLGTLIGSPSAAATKMRIRRDPELAALALRMGSRRRWRASEVMRLMETRRLKGAPPR